MYFFTTANVADIKLETDIVEKHLLAVKKKTNYYTLSLTTIMLRSRTSCFVIRVQLQLENDNRGPGLWKFNKSLLEDEIYVEQTKIQNIPGILVQLDFCKAFHTIEWSFIKRSLALFNFGDSLQQWVSTFYNNSESAVLNNGFCTNFFKLSRGVRQGCPLSPYLFIVGAEILACKIRQDKTIKGITVFQKELKLSQFADDTTLLCNDCNSVNRAITVLNSFGNLSGLRLNPSKTKALWLGSAQ